MLEAVLGLGPTPALAHQVEALQLPQRFAQPGVRRDALEVRAPPMRRHGRRARRARALTRRRAGGAPRAPRRAPGRCRAAPRSRPRAGRRRRPPRRAAGCRARSARRGRRPRRPRQAGDADEAVCVEVVAEQERGVGVGRREEPRRAVVHEVALVDRLEAERVPLLAERREDRLVLGVRPAQRVAPERRLLRRRRARSRPRGQPSRRSSPAASTVRSMSSSECASETNIASNWDGAT